MRTPVTSRQFLITKERMWSVFRTKKTQTERRIPMVFETIQPPSLKPRHRQAVMGMNPTPIARIARYHVNILNLAAPSLLASGCP